MNSNLLGLENAKTNISDAFAIYKNRIEQDQSLTIYSLNIVAENYFRDVLNFVYEYNLTNTNFETKNAPFVDLVDDDKKLAYQVTTTGTKSKIEKTLKALEVDKYKDYKIRLLFLLKKPKLNKKTITQLEGEYSITNLEESLLNFDDLFKDINNLETNKLIELRDKYFVFSDGVRNTNHTSLEFIKNSCNFIDHQKELALVNLIGSWDENNENDKLIIGIIVDEDYSQWIKKVRLFLHQENSPVELYNGVWNVEDRKNIWDKSALYIYDEELDRLKEIALTVLKEKNPSFELKTSERYLANMQGKVLKHSNYLRKGIAETIAIIGNNSKKLTNCSFDKKTYFATSITRTIFKDIDWKLWAGLDGLLPTLAQASPDTFLEQVKNTMTNSPELLIELFNQEGDGMFGGSYTTGLLWALEALAWDEKLFANVGMILAGLADIDPGGRMVNRPANSLGSILLPWFSGTNATIKQKKNLVKTISKKYDQVAWDLLFNLLPNQRQFTTPTYKPSWLAIEIKENAEVLKADYWSQCNFYADLIVSQAGKHIDKLIALLGSTSYLTDNAFNQLLKNIESSEIVALIEEERLPLYFSLIDLISEHTKFQDTDWALSLNKIQQIEQVAQKLKPKDLFNVYQRLFTANDFDLYEENGDYDQKREWLDTKRKNAIQEILKQQGLEKVIEFSLLVENSRLVGISLVENIENNIDKEILPALLTTESKKEREFIAGYCYQKYQQNGLDWLKSFDVTSWNVNKKADLLKNIEPEIKVWEKVSEWLSNKENLYWDKISLNPYWDGFSGFDFVIDKLLKYNRPNTAIDVICAMMHKKLPLNIKKSVKALLANGKTVKENQYDQLNSNSILKVIKALQQFSKVSEDDLFDIEWSYLENVNRIGRDLKPITIENKMATSPDFFCKLVQYAYKSSNDTSQKDLNEQEKNVAQTAYNLLHYWKTIPGFLADEFSRDNFNSWLKSVKDICKKSGHFDSAMQVIGQTLVHTPPDESGLWINKTIAQALDDDNSKNMRLGFDLAVVNSRGVHMVDPTGKSEDELANKYHSKAGELEKNGYINFAQTLYDISGEYQKDAERVRDKHTQD